ncbi:hypothetical protein EDD17DRAFT_434782 [Pisolithus thermaeus]|nr:hypothetical protein F5141DRAFT_17930 [Pisolithus sp. B1]KAI6163774.1 hypothetical protein EDD17DRAFT_434782 [Pisolithus thermaeus]
MHGRSTLGLSIPGLWATSPLPLSVGHIGNNAYKGWGGGGTAAKYAVGRLLCSQIRFEMVRSQHIRTSGSTNQRTVMAMLASHHIRCSGKSWREVARVQICQERFQNAKESNPDRRSTTRLEESIIAALWAGVVPSSGDPPQLRWQTR